MYSLVQQGKIFFQFTFSNTDSLVVRRSNLFGQELRVMVHDQPPYLHTRN